MKIKTSELKGAALDWAVAMASKIPVVTFPSPFTPGRNVYRKGDHSIFYPSGRWDHVGPLIEEHCVLFDTDDKSIIWAKLPEQSLFNGGESHLVAACRAIVMAKLGEEVEIPEELCGESK